MGLLYRRRACDVAKAQADTVRTLLESLCRWGCIRCTYRYLRKESIKIGKKSKSVWWLHDQEVVGFVIVAGILGCERPRWECGDTRGNKVRDDRCRQVAWRGQGWC